MSTAPDAPQSVEPATCTNCGAPAPRAFCAECGQDTRDRRAPLLRLCIDFQREVLALDAKLVRSLGRLFARPGELARRFLEGKRASVLPPVRLALVASVFFFTLSHFDAPAPGTTRITVGDVVVQEKTRSRVSLDIALLRPGTDSMLLTPFLEGSLEERRAELLAMPPALIEYRFFQLSQAALASFWILVLPLLGCVLWLLFLRRGFLFYDHLVFLLYEQAFAFFLFGATALLAGLLPDLRAAGLLTLVALVGFAVHVGLALRRTYGRPWPGTLARTLCLLAAWGMTSLLTLIAVGLYASVAI